MQQVAYGIAELEVTCQLGFESWFGWTQNMQDV